MLDSPAMSASGPLQAERCFLRAMQVPHETMSPSRLTVHQPAAAGPTMHLVSQKSFQRKQLKQDLLRGIEDDPLSCR